MSDQNSIVFGIDLGTTYSCIAYVDEYGKAIVVPNKENSHTTPSVILFEGESRIVGDEAKNSALLYPEHVVEMVKRHMGEPDWRFSYDGKEYSPEEISSYILRKLANDTEEALNIPVKEVVITCPAYFGIAQREATARAGEIAGLKVREIINEPTAAAITYGLQNEQDQVVLVYDLGGGTFDITVIEIKNGKIEVIATGGDHHLGGRDWDEAVVGYFAEQWQQETGSPEDPIESPDTLQAFWIEAEKAKLSLTSRIETKRALAHAGQYAKVTLTRDKFNELTRGLLDRTILFTKMTMDDARQRGYSQFDQILLVGGSTHMPQVSERLERDFCIPVRRFDPHEAVAKGAAMYGQKLFLDQQVLDKAAEIGGEPAGAIDPSDIKSTVLEQAQIEVARESGLRLKTVEQLFKTKITNVASHSFGIFATPKEREAISNLVLANDPLPVSQMRRYGTLEANQQNVELRVMETSERASLVEQQNYTSEAEIGLAVLQLPPGLPANTPIEVTFELNEQGRLHLVGHEPRSGAIVEATFEVKGGISQTELQEAKARSKGLAIL